MDSRQRGTAYFTFHKEKAVKGIGSLMENGKQVDWAFMMEETAVLHKPIQVNALNKAINTALLVHPALRECRYVRDGVTYLYFEDQETAAKPEIAGQRYSLGSMESTRRYQFVVTYGENAIHLYLHHELADGRGMHQFFATMLFYYLLFRGEAVVADSAITTLETPFDPTELEHLEDRLLTLPAAPLPIQQPAAFFNLNPPLRHADQPFFCCSLHIPFAELKALSARMEASPASVILPVYARAIAEIHGDTNAPPLRFSLPVDLRDMFNSKSLRNSYGSIHVRYPMQLLNRPFDFQATVIRGQMDLQMQPEYFCGRGNKLLVPTNPPVGMQGSAPQNTTSAAGSRLVFSNIGKYTMAKSMVPLVQDVFVRPLVRRHVATVGASSFGSELRVFAVRQFESDKIFRRMAQCFCEMGINARFSDEGTRLEPVAAYDVL